MVNAECRYPTATTNKRVVTFIADLFESHASGGARSQAENTFKRLTVIRLSTEGTIQMGYRGIEY